mmetsp:Transcript_64640/g.104534  ORF Transcript_64640/g.104534 Transcript_64640/m.104534 type:complete len:244 (+) Transcript_64640:47-778(+)
MAGRQSIGAIAIRLAPLHSGGPVGACRPNPLAPCGTWDFPLSKGEKVQRLLKLYDDEVARGKGVEEQLQYEANCLEAEVGSFSLDLERSEAEVKRLEAETSDLRAAVGCCEEALASMEQFEEENKDLLVELHKFTDCSRSAAVPCRLGAPLGGEERAQRPSRSRSPGLIPGRPRARRVAAESLDSRLLVKAPGAEEHIAGTPRPRLHSCSSGMSPRSDFNLQESFHRSRWVLAVDAPQLLRGF